MLLQIGVRVPDSHDPLGLLAASLRRHLSRLRMLSFASAHLLDPDRETREQAAAGLEEALSFFQRAADDPFRDEAEILFPWLLARTRGDRELERTCEALLADRPKAARLQLAVAQAGALLAHELTTGPLRALGQSVDALDELYRAHLDRLEDAVFPRVQPLLEEPDRDRLGESMLEATSATVSAEGHSQAPASPGVP